MKTFLPIFISFLLLMTFTSCEKLQNEKTIKLAHGLDINHPVHKAMILMGEELEKNSKGKLKLEIYPNQQLGSERQCLELIQIGSLDMTKVSAAVMENFSPDMRVFGLPFIFKDRKHTFNVLDGAIGKELLDGGQKYWLKGLGYYDAGSRSFYTKEQPVETPEDLEGLKIRVMESITAMRMVTSLGGSPTPISSGELYTALQQGVVDGAENNPPTFYLSRQYEVCKFFSLDEHTTIPDVLIISTHLWNTLNAQEKEWLQSAVNVSVDYQRKLWAKAELNALEAVKEAGVTIIKPDKTMFKNKVESIYESYKNDEQVYSLIKRIQESQ
ncbi:TRAP transporter substrate-binding protein [Winogradskyella thalassocola]|uniref:Tripartite ATP-independent transporter solute receptor, DctP family n=1 Tax=Winogradskyella thalassocola TaxID=262004 RepID=A0A1G7X007_9FLAO|nr:TRAP transporter substrate-binding protein [Winogradskyella thalassocola]SDG77513.1 tripartite ATP-independent transporter solute receptor, DctP family [Winogradskyella thalassocola]